MAAAVSAAATSAAKHEVEKEPAEYDPYHPSVLCPHAGFLLAQEPFDQLICITHATVPKSQGMTYPIEFIVVCGIRRIPRKRRRQYVTHYSDRLFSLRRIFLNGPIHREAPCHAYFCWEAGSVCGKQSSWSVVINGRYARRGIGRNGHE